MIQHKYGCEYDIVFRRVKDSDIEKLNGFDCGNENINHFVRGCLSTAKDVSYVFLDNENQQIVCFCSVCCSAISVNELQGKDRKPVRTNYPSVEIDFFAVDEKYRSKPFDKNSKKHETLSNAFLLYFINFLKGISKTVVGFTYLSLYSVPEAVSFYNRFGFEGFEPYMNRDEAVFTENCIPMFLPIDSLDDK